MTVGDDPEHIWYHTIDLPDGSVTPGYADTRAARPYVEWPAALRGGRCLDVGTFDGFWAFEMESRGAAEVVALDIDDPEELDWSYDLRETGPDRLREARVVPGEGFARASAALESSVTRVVTSVYGLDPDTHGHFDVVFCGALLLHLRDPVRALERMRSACRGELVLVERLDPTLELLAPRTPSARVTPRHDMWWMVNSAGMLSMLERAGFELVGMSKRFLVPHGPAFTGKPALIDSLAARTLRRRGGLHRSYRARPRPPAGV